MKVTFEGITKRFGSTRALDSVSGVIDGNVNLILGSNGSGKTTLLNILAGLSWPDEGRLEIDGSEFSRSDKRLWRKRVEEFRKTVSMLPDKPGYPYSFTGSDLLEFSSGRNQVSKHDKARSEHLWLSFLLETLEMQDYIAKPIGSYSSGMMQKIGLASSLAQKPKIVFWDEPTSGLDAVSRTSVITLVRKLVKEGSTFVITSHIPEDFEGVADWVGLMRLGKLIRSGRLSAFESDTNAYLLETDKPALVASKLLESGIASGVKLDRQEIIFEARAHKHDLLNENEVKELCSSLGAITIRFAKLPKSVSALYQELLRS